MRRSQPRVTLDVSFVRVEAARGALAALCLERFSLASLGFEGGEPGRGAASARPLFTGRATIFYRELIPAGLGLGWTSWPAGLSDKRFQGDRPKIAARSRNSASTLTKVGHKNALHPGFRDRLVDRAVDDKRGDDAAVAQDH